MKRPIVVKIGGATFGKHDSILEDIVTLQKREVPLVVIHGGGNMVTDWLKRQGVTSTFVRGERVTDRISLEVATAVLSGLANKQVVGAILTMGGRAVGISGIDGALVKAAVINPELGFVGANIKVDITILEVLLKGGFIPVISPISYFAFDRPENAPPMLNINGDPLAGEIAAALAAQKLIFLTDVAGINNKEGKLLTRLDKTQAQALIDTGIASGGMIPKIRGALRALEAGTISYIIDGRKPNELVKTIDDNVTGTVIA